MGDKKAIEDARADHQGEEIRMTIEKVWMTRISER